MVNITLSNFLSSFKIIKKSALILPYIGLFTCSVQASNNLNDWADRIEEFVNQRIILPSTDLLHDMNKHVERRIRPKSSNYVDRTLQDVLDSFEDVQDKTERKVKRPIENWITKYLK